jgi:IgGFc binding protein
VPEPEYYRVLAVSDEGPTRVVTNLPAPDDELVLPQRGAHFDLMAYSDFALSSDRPVVFASIQASQDASGVRRPLPGGDPSLVIVPPLEQFRPDYVFLTPDKYAFDFIVIAAPPDAEVTIDGRAMGEYACDTAWANGGGAASLSSVLEAKVHRCQLSFPIIDPDLPPEEGVFPGEQNDGVHRVLSDRNIGVLVYGFDERVSYGYAAGTQLEAISIR